MLLEQLEDRFTKYEVARILGARALQVAMDAPLLLKIPDQELEDLNFNPIEIAKKELIADVLPITVNRPLPPKKEEKLKTLSKEEIHEIKKKAEEKEDQEKAEKQDKKADEKLEKLEEKEQEKIAQEGEIMELAKPEDEAESELQQTPEGEEEL